MKALLTIWQSKTRGFACDSPDSDCRCIFLSVPLISLWERIRTKSGRGFIFSFSFLPPPPLFPSPPALRIIAAAFLRIYRLAHFYLPLRRREQLNSTHLNSLDVNSTDSAQLTQLNSTHPISPDLYSAQLTQHNSLISNQLYSTQISSSQLTQFNSTYLNSLDLNSTDSTQLNSTLLTVFHLISTQLN